MKKTSKTEAKKKIREFFQDIQDKSPKEVKKIKRLAMSHNLPLKENRKKFCKKCLAPYKNPKIRIRRKIKIMTCKNCWYSSRYRI